MLLIAENLCKNYQQGNVTIEVLRGVNLAMEPGTSAAIIGESGSGKSTLLALLGGLDQPSRGQVIFSSKNLQTLGEETLAQLRREELGFVFQQFYLMQHLNALENIRLPLDIQNHPEAEARAMSLLQAIGLQARAHHLPRELSGGENQRLAIARALITQPKLLLADEPSGNLDQQTGQQVMQLLFSLVGQEKTAMILVTHNPALAKMCDRCLRLQDGKLTAIK